MELKLSGGRGCFYQWDTGQKLVVEGAEACNEVHFSSRAAQTALVCRIREEDGHRVAEVPNILLQEDATITAYLYCYAEDGSETRLSKSFQVLRRPKPDSYVYTETEVLSYTALDQRITALEDSDKTEMVNAVLTALPTWSGGSY